MDGIENEYLSNLYAQRGEVYSFPEFSYYVASDEHDSPQNFFYNDGCGEAQNFDGRPAATEEYQPKNFLQEYLKRHIGRRLLQERYVGHLNKPYRIPLWDQACLKYMFAAMFEGGIDFMEFFFITKAIVMMAVNCFSVGHNVFGGDSTASYLESVTLMARVVFIIEFAVVFSLLLFLFIVIIDALRRDDISTNLAGDIAALSDRISTFSALRVVAIVSPAFLMEKILPLVQNAFGLKDYIKAFFFIFLWICACILAVIALVLKLTQVDFAVTRSINEWTFGEVVKLVGFTMNLARLNDSYATETQVLLDAVHRHFCPPGRPKDAVAHSACLYTRFCTFLGIPLYTTYEYFDVIFDYHFKCKNDSNYLTCRMKVRKMLNYLVFILRMDNTVLRRFLQMTQSPLPFYKLGRDAFTESFKEGDILGMITALWRCDPSMLSTKRFARSNKNEFNITFECDDGSISNNTNGFYHFDHSESSEQQFCKKIFAACNQN